MLLLFLGVTVKKILGYEAKLYLFMMKLQSLGMKAIYFSLSIYRTSFGDQPPVTPHDTARKSLCMVRHVLLLLIPKQTGKTFLIQN